MAIRTRRRRILIAATAVVVALVIGGIWSPTPNPRFVGTWAVYHDGQDIGNRLVFKADGTARGYYLSESRWRWFRWHATESRFERLPQLAPGFQPFRFVEECVARLTKGDTSGFDVLRIENDFIELRDRNPHIKMPVFELRRVKPTDAVRGGLKAMRR
jgi:hypothetical protein